MRDNEAYKWLRYWCDHGGVWSNDTCSGVWPLYMRGERRFSNGYKGFEKDMEQLLKDAELGRKIRECGNG